MSTTLQHTQSIDQHHATADAAKRHLFEIVSLGNALGTFLAVAFTLCVAFDLAFPSLAMYSAYMAGWEPCTCSTSSCATNAGGNVRNYLPSPHYYYYRGMLTLSR